MAVMATCAECGAEIMEHASFCPKCGAAAPEMGASGAEDPEVTALLTAANLSRIRRSYEDALQKCKEALQKAPDSAAAHSLLGDILSDQKRVVEAALWYQMALQIDPGNVTLKTKAERAQMLARGYQAAAQAAPRDTDGQSRVDRFVRGEGYRTLLNIITMVLAGLALIVLVAFVISQITGENVAQNEEDLRSGLPAATSRQRGARYVPPSGRQADTSQQAPAAQSSQQSGSRQTLPSGITEPETVFLNRLRAQSEGSAVGSNLETAYSDPRDYAVTILFSVPGPRVDRVALLRQAKSYAQAAYAMEPRAALVTVRAVANLSNGAGVTSRQIAFIGDISPDSANRGMDDNAQAQTFEMLFTNTYWHPDLRVQPTR